MFASVKYLQPSLISVGTVVTYSGGAPDSVGSHFYRFLSGLFTPAYL